MSRIDDYFQDELVKQYDHPLMLHLLHLKSQPEFADVRVEIVRPETPLGHQPATMVLHVFAKAGGELDRPQPEDWDDELNAALVQSRVRAIDAENEAVRFGLGLRAALQGAESRFGDGFFNAVLVHHIERSPFKDHPAVARTLPYVLRSNGSVSGGRSQGECRAMIDGALRRCAMQLTKQLGYEVGEAVDILAVALSKYLDDRFSVSSRKALGFL